MMASFVLVKIVDNSTFHMFLNVIWIVAIFICVVSDVVSLNASVFLKWIICVGLAVRIVVVVLALGDYGAITDFLYSHDTSGFRWNAYNYYAGDYSFYYTKYPYVINAIFHIFGPYMVMPHLLNVLLWYLGFRLMVYGVAARGDLHGKKHQILTLFYWLMPMQVLWTSALYRESIIVFFMMMSVTFAIKWKETSKIVFIIMAAISLIPSMLLHAGNSSALIAIFLLYVLWNKKDGKWEILSWKMALILVVFALFEPLYQIFVTILPPGYFPSTLSFSTIARENSNLVFGRTDYISEHTVATNIKEFVLISGYRMFYFWASPTPKYWGEATDVLAFFVDTIPWLIFLCCYVKQMKKCKTSAGWIGVFLFLAYTFVYGWGTSNAGTAIRHRGEMIAPLTFLFMYMIQNENSGNTNVVEE